MKQIPILMLIVLIPLVALWGLLGLGDSRHAPPEFVLYVNQPRPAKEGSPPLGKWADPLAVAAIGGRLFVLDSGNDRVLELDKTGKATASLCEEGECQFLLKNPQAMAAHAEELYIANTGAGQIVMLSTDGSLIKAIDIALPGAPEGKRFSASGIAVSATGEVFVTDTARDLVLRLSKGGQSTSVFLDARGESEKYRASKPVGLAVDIWGNLYVANSGDGRIRKYSPGGRHLEEFSMRGNPAYFSPTFVAVDVQGNVYFTDSRSRMVYVYDEAGRLAGVVGLLDAGRVDSPKVLQEPWGLHMEGDTLYVADKASGLFGFRIDPEYWKTAQPSRGLAHP